VLVIVYFASTVDSKYVTCTVRCIQGSLNELPYVFYSINANKRRLIAVFPDTMTTNNNGMIGQN